MSKKPAPDITKSKEFIADTDDEYPSDDAVADEGENLLTRIKNEERKRKRLTEQKLNDDSQYDLKVDNNPTSSTTEPADLDATEYEIESIKDYKQDNNGKILCRIRWKGYSKEDDTWEPESNLNDGALEELRALKKRREENSSH